ncbi:hypothetical protein M758_1G064800 [Ceratodon purpureus]|nr:hypothetical protein M758_1G064800 [Ceratodon purpureus]
MQRSCALLRGLGASSSRRLVDNAVKGALVPDARRSLSTSSADAVSNEKIVAAVVVERLPVVLPDMAPAVEAFESFSFDWRQQFRREYPQEFLDASSSREADEGEAEFEPAPTVTEADKTNDRRSLQRALTRRLYLLIRGIPYGGAKDTPVWHFPEKEYAKEDSLRLCAEEVIKPFVSDPKDVYFVGNAPCGHLHYRLSEPNYKRFFFKSQLITGKVQVKGKKIKDYAWVSKEELPEYLDPSDLEYMKKMLID